VDDKINARAAERYPELPPEVGIRKLTEETAAQFHKDIAALGVLPPTVEPRATEHIQEMVDLCNQLVANGHAYVAADHVLFDVSSMPDYGKLSNRSLEEMEAGARVEVAPYKKGPMDFVLWKPSDASLPGWDSPWGRGRPGWHIECSAMSRKFLGDQIDIHGGGQDVVFPHHENEIVQSENFTGKKPFVQYWMHNGLLRMGEDKMSKSLGNLITIRDALKKYSADAIRIFVLSSYYRTPLTYTEEALEAAQGGAERLRQTILVEDSEEPPDNREYLDTYKHQFIQAMDDDFNTAQALASLFDLARVINRLRNKGSGAIHGQLLLIELAKVLGLNFKERQEPPLEIDSLRKLAASFEEKVTGAGVIMPDIPDDANEVIKTLISVRKKLRDNKQFQLADEIRSASSEIGILLEDTPTGTVWKRKR